MTPNDDTQPIARRSQRRAKVPTSWWTWLLVLTTAAWVVVVSGVVLLVLVSQGTPVTLLLSSQKYDLTTQATTVQDFLREINITLEDGDFLAPSLDTPVTPGLIVQINRARAVTLTVDGESRLVRTTFDTPLEILNSVGVRVMPQDRVVLDGSSTDAVGLTAWAFPVNTIRVRHAATLTVVDDGASSTIQTTDDTVGEALFDAGMILYLADTITPDLNAPIAPNLTITIRRARPITITADGMTLTTRAQGTNVGDALAAAGVTLVGLDYAVPDLDTPLSPGLTVRVVRVHEEVVSEQTAIPFDTIYQADASMELDQRQTVQLGSNGAQQVNTRVRYEDNVEVSREPETPFVLSAPTNRVIAYGTNVVIRSVDTPDGPREYWRHFRMYATSYHPKPLGGNDITATGRKLMKGIVGIDPNIIPYGTALYVPGYGDGIAADTGAPRSFHYWIDLGYSDADYQHWSRWVDVYLLTPVPSKINYLLPEK